MARTPLFDRLARAASIAWFCDHRKISTREGLERVAEATARYDARRLSRRAFLSGVGKAAAAAAVGAVAGPLVGSETAFGGSPGNLDVGIVGAGLAGLTCARTLAKKGINARLYEAANRAGGRCWSTNDVNGDLNSLFPGQVGERGGEFIDNLHKTMLGYANEFGLAREDLFDNPGEVFYWVHDPAAGTHVRHPEHHIVDLFREFNQVIRDDLRLSSGAPTSTTATDYDRALDAVSIADYLAGKNSGNLAADPVLQAGLISAYDGEYGRECAIQSALNFILFIKASRRSKLALFGVQSNERWHLVNGNGQIPENLAQSLGGYADQGGGPIERGMALMDIRRDGSRVKLTFKDQQVRLHDFVVVTIPFSVLRAHVNLHASLGIGARLADAIKDLGYGFNAKTLISFSKRPWIAQGSQGTVYTDLDDVQIMFETNPNVPNGAPDPVNAPAIWTRYTSGDVGFSLAGSVDTEVSKCLAALEPAFPGANLAGAARKVDGKFVAHREHWPKNRLSEGSYTCYLVNQFTKYEGEMHPKLIGGNLVFAGEHTNSFHVWQGFMEGAALSGIDAANAILRA
jgi:monoamine oxidase